MIRYCILALFMISVVDSAGQSLLELLKKAEQNYPLLKSKGYEVQSKQALGQAARNTAVPSLDAAYQLNYATYNNITGMATPQGFVPISGPPSQDNSYTGVFGSAGGLLMNWEPVTFGQRKATIESARAQLAYQEADAALERFQHQVRTATAYLDALLIDELITVQNKNLERVQEQTRTVKALARSGLRPATDTAAMNADLSAAKIELLNSSRMRETYHLQLAEMLGEEQVSYTREPRFFETLPAAIPGRDTTEHPVLRLNTSQMMIHLREKDYLNRTLFPKISVWGTAYARGSGIQWDGTVNTTDGLGFSRYNYGTGLVLSVPLLRFSTVRPQVRSQEALIKADEERLSLIKLQLNQQARVAEVTLASALAVAQENPNFYHSADFSYRAQLSRYNSGLSNYADLVQAQYVLLKAEVDLKRSYAEAWKALLYLSAVRGDLTLFLNQLQ